MRRIKLPIRRPWIPTIILVLSLLITILATLYVSRSATEQDRLRYENAVQQTQNNINNHLETYIALIRGTSGLVAARPSLTEEEFHSYVQRLRLQERYPGIQGMGYVVRVPAAEKEAFVTNTQTQDQSEFTIKPEGERPEYFPVLYLEPYTDQNNQTVIGYDMSSDQVHRRAMDRARDTGLRAASGKVTFLQEKNKKKHASFHIFIPHYGDSEIPKTVDERRSQLKGFMYSPIRADNLLTDISGDDTYRLIQYQVYDGDETKKENLLYDSSTNTNNPEKNHTPRFQSVRHINIAGEQWTITFSNSAIFENGSQIGFVPLIFLGGLLLSAVVFLLSRSQYIARTVAEKSASKLMQSQRELQRAIGIRDNFISIASHELKTPLTSLKVYAEVLLRRFTQKGQTEAASYMDKMNKQIDKLTDLIADLLDVSRLQSGHMVFREEKFDLNLMIREVIDNTNSIAENHTIHLKGAVKHAVWGDKDRLSQVLSNFLTNAIKYSPKADKVLVSVKERNNIAVVSVQDFGLGIEKVHQKKIFNRFYRVSDADEQTYPGLGIGLYICHEIIKRHGGEILVESSKGKGSTFSFTIPYI